MKNCFKWENVTVTNNQKLFLQSCVDEIRTYGTEKIGVPDVVVEIDKLKFRKQKYNKGHRVEDRWMFSRVERTVECKIFVYVVCKRNKENLNPIIQQNICPGSIINSDC